MQGSVLGSRLLDPARPVTGRARMPHAAHGPPASTRAEGMPECSTGTSASQTLPLVSNSPSNTD